MRNYIIKLVDQLDSVANNPPQATHPKRSSLMTIDLAISKSIEEWTGIEQIVFPDISRLAPDEIMPLNSALQQVLDSLNLLLADKPEDIPLGLFYKVITDHWQDDVLYLTSPGWDWELCTGDPKTCPWGGYCSCGGEPLFSLGKVPLKYQTLVKEIAENIDCGFVCYLNTDTLECENVVPDQEYDHELFEDTTGETWESYYTFDRWDNSERFSQPSSHESFKIMEKFVGTVPDEKLQQKLYNALDRRRPFANFKDIIDDSDYREAWFAFRASELQEYVWTIMEEHISDM